MNKSSDGQPPSYPPRAGIKRGVYLLPNLFTTASLFLGFMAIVRSLRGDFVTASWAIFAAGLCDGLDGRVARLARAESEFGIEYDSLVDLVAFGLAPSILIYTWSLHQFPRYGWMVAFLFTACGALRLARFNVQASTVERNYFQGLPIPMAAGMILTTVLFHHYLLGRAVMPTYHGWLLALTVLLSLLMISNVRYRSFKRLNFRSRWSFFVLALVAVLIALVAMEPEIALFSISASYISWGLIEALVTMRRRSRVFAQLRERRQQRRARRAEARRLQTEAGTLSNVHPFPHKTVIGDEPPS